MLSSYLESASDGNSIAIMAKYIVILAMLLISRGHALPADETRGLRQLLNLVKFQNNPCVSSEPNRIGTCVARGECNGGGREAGNCAAGIGVCCIYVISPPTNTVTRNCTYITNTIDTTVAAPADIAVTLNRIGNDICQVRLDFNTLQLGDPVGGACTVDSLTITTPTAPTASPAFGGPLCGTLSGQHVYMDTGTTGNAATLDFSFNGAAMRVWDIKVNYIECTNPNKPPEGCSQWFTGTSGLIQSLNYDDALLARLTYSSCVRRERGYCTVQYSVDPGTGNPDGFKLEDAATPNIAERDCATRARIEFETLLTPDTNMFCGEFFNGLDGNMVNGAVDGSLPSTLRFIGSGTADALTGYSLRYSQKPCGPVTP